MSERVRIQVGDVQLEYEGDAFSPTIADELMRRAKELAKISSNGSSPGVNHHSNKSNGANGTSSGSGITGTTATLAGKLKVASGNDLLIAAAARLVLVAGKDEFPRQDLLDEMRGASGYYRESYGKNFTNYLQRRLKAGELIESRKGFYALEAKRRHELEVQLAG